MILKYEFEVFFTFVCTKMTINLFLLLLVLATGFVCGDVVWEDFRWKEL